MSTILFARPSGLRTFTSRRTLSARFYSSETPSDLPKPSVKLIAELRKQANVSLPLARQALSESALSIDDALAWLAARNDKKGSKLAESGRATNEGLVGTYVVSPGVTSRMRAPVWAGVVEMNCETDFVARGELFGQLLAEIAHSAAFHSEMILEATAKADPSESSKQQQNLFKTLSLPHLLDAPLISYSNPSVSLPTVSQSLRTLMGKVGENISIRRVSVVKQSMIKHKDLGLRVAAYGHGGTFSAPGFSSGRIASLTVLALKAPVTETRPTVSEWLRGVEGKKFGEDLEEIEAALARQVAGFPVTSIEPKVEGDEGALYNQPFLMYPHAQGGLVKDVLAKWGKERGLVEEEAETGLKAVEFLKWTVGGDSVVGK